MKYALVLGIIFCGCTIDSAVETSFGMAIWMIAFATVMTFAVKIGEGHR